MQQSALILSNIIIVVDNQHRRLVSIFAHHLLHLALVLIAIVDILQCRLVGERLLAFSLILNNCAISLTARNNNNEVGTLANFALHLDFAIMQFHKRLHQSQANASSAGSTLSLKETFEHLACFFFLNTLACIANIDTKIVACRSKANKDITASRCIFHGITQKIKHHASHLLLVGNYHVVGRVIIIHEMQLYLLALGSKIKVASP